MRYSHKVFIYRRRFHLFLTLFFSALSVCAILIFMKFNGISILELARDLLASSFRVAVAYLISVLIAIATAILVTRNKYIEDIFLPILDVLQSFPSFAILPVAILFLGKGDVTAIFFLVITILWPVLFNIISGVKSFRGDVAEASIVFGAAGFKKLRYFLIPALLPSIVIGSIIGWGEAWEAIVGAEIIGISSGVGAFLDKASKSGQTNVLVVGIIALLFFIFFLNKLIWLPFLKKATQYSTEE